MLPFVCEFVSTLLKSKDLSFIAFSHNHVWSSNADQGHLLLCVNSCCFQMLRVLHWTFLSLWKIYSQVCTLWLIQQRQQQHSHVSSQPACTKELYAWLLHFTTPHTSVPGDSSIDRFSTGENGMELKLQNQWKCLDKDNRNIVHQSFLVMCFTVSIDTEVCDYSWSWIRAISFEVCIH